MKSLYISQPGCSVSLKQEQLLVKRNKEILQIVQLPHLEQIFIFSASQVTTQAIHACLWRQIPLAKPPKRGIVYLSRMGRCYGRLTPIESKFRGLPRSQHNLSPKHRITTVLWNHLHSLIEIAGLDPYEGVLHTGSDRHAALVSDLLEGYGKRVQWSVFECQLSVKKYQELRDDRRSVGDHRLQSRVKPEDNIRFYPISAHTVGTIEVWGSGPTLTEIPGSFIV